MDDLKNFICFCAIALAFLIGVCTLVIGFTVVGASDSILDAIEDQPTYVEQTQPPVEDDILCYDYATGHVYSAFTRDDGNVQLRINPEGNRVIAQTVDPIVPTRNVEEDAEK